MKSVKREAGNHANFSGISKYSHVFTTFSCRVSEVFFNGKSTLSDFFYFMHNNFIHIHFIQTWENVRESSKQHLNFTHLNFLLWRTILAQPPNFEGQIITKAQECRNFMPWLKPCHYDQLKMPEMQLQCDIVYKYLHFQNFWCSTSPPPDLHRDLCQLTTTLL